MLIVMCGEKMNRCRRVVFNNDMTGDVFAPHPLPLSVADLTDVVEQFDETDVDTFVLQVATENGACPHFLPFSVLSPFSSFSTEQRNENGACPHFPVPIFLFDSFDSAGVADSVATRTTHTVGKPAFLAPVQKKQLTSVHCRV